MNSTVACFLKSYPCHEGQGQGLWLGPIFLTMSKLCTELEWMICSLNFAWGHYQECLKQLKEIKAQSEGNKYFLEIAREHELLSIL